MMYACPVCKSPVEEKGAAYYCLECSLSFPKFRQGDLELINFNAQLSKSGVCKCIVDGNTQCEVDIREVIAKAKPHVHRFNSRATRYLKRFCGVDNKVLDLGCSYGEVGHWLGDRNMVIGLDVCPKLLAQAVVSPGIKYKSLVVNNGIDLPFTDGYFDVVVALEVIEHTLDTRGFVDEIYRVLRPGGRIAISCPNLVSIWLRFSILFGSGIGISPASFISSRGKASLQSRWVGIRYPEQTIHLRFFTAKSLTRFLGEWGFQRITLFGSDPIISNLGLGVLFRNLCESIWAVFEKP